MDDMVTLVSVHNSSQMLYLMDSFLMINAGNAPADLQEQQKPGFRTAFFSGTPRRVCTSSTLKLSIKTFKSETMLVFLLLFVFVFEQRVAFCSATPGRVHFNF